MTSEEQQLTAIESQLSESDPRLAAMFAVFTCQPALRQGPVSERVTPWRPAGDPAAPARWRTSSRVVLLVVLAFLVIACVAAGVMEASQPAWPARVIHSTDFWGTGGYR